MAYKLIQLMDGTLVQIEVTDSQAQEISSQFADKVDATLSAIKPIIAKVGTSISEAWKEVSDDLQIESAEVEIGFGFEGEGNIYITKAKASSNITVKLLLKPNK